MKVRLATCTINVDCASPTFHGDRLWQPDASCRMALQGASGQRRGSGTFYWVGLIVEVDYIFSDVRGGEEDRAVLRGIVQDGAIAVAWC